MKKIGDEKKRREDREERGESVERGGGKKRRVSTIPPSHFSIIPLFLLCFPRIFLYYSEKKEGKTEKYGGRGRE